MRDASIVRVNSQVYANRFSISRSPLCVPPLHRFALSSVRRFAHPLLHALLACVLALLFTSCYYSHPNQTDHWAEVSEGGVDSVNFYITHHSWIGYNFRTTDSMELQPFPLQMGVADYALLQLRRTSVRKHDDLVVARIQYVPADTVDSVWVKVARDQVDPGLGSRIRPVRQGSAQRPNLQVYLSFFRPHHRFCPSVFGHSRVVRPYPDLPPQALPNGTFPRHTRLLPHVALSYGQFLCRPLRQYSVLCSQHLGRVLFSSHAQSLQHRLTSHHVALFSFGMVHIDSSRCSY